MDGYEKFEADILRLTSIDLTCYKEKQMKRRIETLVTKNGQKSFADYFTLIKTNKEKFDEFINFILGIARAIRCVNEKNDLVIVVRNAVSENHARKHGYRENHDNHMKNNGGYVVSCEPVPLVHSEIGEQRQTYCRNEKK